MLRPPSCAGSVYPEDPAVLRAALDVWLAFPGPSRSEGRERSPPSFVEADGRERFPSPSPRRGEGRGDGRRVAEPRAPRLVVSPHVDYPRGARAYAHAARALAASDAELFVVFGTAHETPPHLFTLTRRDYATPLGPVATDRGAVDAIAAEVGEREVLGSERCHDGEHSVELQLVLLRHLVARPFTALPVLCSSISHLADPTPFTARFLAALARAVAGRRVCFVAGADLAHVGPLYGDRRAPTTAEVKRVEEDDRRTLSFLASGDARGFHADAVRDDARRRLCGTAPIYAAMRASGAGARLLHYERWTDGRDSVSFAAAAG